jgi:cytochrome c-type biogenesis protein CcmH/NrfG
MLGIAGCGRGGDLQIRPLAAPISASAKPVPFRIAEANGHLVLGNVALALESYRKALRDEPQNVDAMVGMATCYDKMARFDISRRYYEAALAVAPSDPRVLSLFAGSLDLQGLGQQASAVRIEMIAAGVIAEDRSVRTAAPEEPAGVAVPQRSAPLPSAPHTQSVTVDLSPARPAVSAVPAYAPDAGAHPERISERVAVRARTVSPQAERDAGVRLERLSLNEVALVTNALPQWRPQLLHRTAQSATIRFVPLKREERTAAVRLLNAARTQGLAAHTRSLLQKRGWQRVAIGDARRMRDRSLVLYSPATEKAARRLSNQFGYQIARQPQSAGLIVLLGRDAARTARSRG